LHGANNPTLGRDAIFAVVMIALNGLVGLSLLLGGLRHREQHYNLQGVNAYLNVIMTLAVLGLVLPNFTTSKSGPNFSTEQEIFFIVMTLSLYAIFLLIQTMRHRGYFMESEDVVLTANPTHHPIQRHSTVFHAAMLLVYLIAVILLSEKFAIPLDNSIEKFNMPQEFGGAMIAALVLSPEGLGAIRASLGNQLQRSINILLGSVLATIGLTIPAVLTIGLITKRSVTLGVQGGNLPLLL
jgi:Ca2+:H+ antiporter